MVIIVNVHCADYLCNLKQELQGPNTELDCPEQVTNNELIACRPCAYLTFFFIDFIFSPTHMYTTTPKPTVYLQDRKAGCECCPLFIHLAA